MARKLELTDWLIEKKFVANKAEASAALIGFVILSILFSIYMTRKITAPKPYTLRYASPAIPQVQVNKKTSAH
jgi:hypothetical protein